MALLGLAVGCTAAPKDSESGQDSGGQDSGGQDSGSADTHLETVWSLEQAEAALLSAFDKGIVEPVTITGWFEPLIFAEQAAITGCYTVDDDGAGTIISEWEGDCTSPNGYHFVGGWLFADVRSEQDGRADLWLRLLASYHITSPDGIVSTGGGEMTMSRSVSADGRLEISMQTGGVYQVPTEDGWLGDGIGAGLDMEVSRDDDGLNVTIDGGVTYQDEATLYFEDVVLSEATCGAMPSGLIQIRDPSSVWFDFDFGQRCDGCATVTVLGEVIGTSCQGRALSDAATTTITRMEG